MRLRSLQMNRRSEDWLQELARDYPALASVAERARGANGGFAQVVFANELTRWLVREWTTGDRTVAERVLRQLDREYSVLNATSRRLFNNTIVRGLPWPGEPGAEVASLMQPAIRAEYDQSHHSGRRASEWLPTLVANNPWLRPTLELHVARHGELLPSLFLADLAGWLETACSGGGEPHGRAVVADIEHSYEQLDSNAQELVRDAFVWMLPTPSDPCGLQIASWLGPTLHSLYERRW